MVEKILGIIDKLDDIVYEPVHALSEWIQEPLKHFESERIAKNKQQDASIKADEMRLQSELDDFNRRSVADLEIDIRKRHAEIDKLIEDQEDARRDRLVESIKQYQLSLASASVEIVNTIGLMSLDLREKANTMIHEKTLQYIKIQDEAKRKSKEELLELKDDFGEESEVFKKMSEEIIQERRSTIELAGNFIKELSEDMKRLNQNTDRLMEKNIDYVNNVLIPMSRVLNVSTNINSSSVTSNLIEQK